MDLLNFFFCSLLQGSLVYFSWETECIFPPDLFSFALSLALCSGPVQVDVRILAELWYAVSMIRTRSDLSKSKLKESEAWSWPRAIRWWPRDMVCNLKTKCIQLYLPLPPTSMKRRWALFLDNCQGSWSQKLPNFGYALKIFISSHLSLIPLF